MTSPSSTWIALFRGINVGGRARLAMNDLAAVLPPVLVIGIDRLQAVIDANPFPEAEQAPTSLRVHSAAAEKLVGVPMTARSWRSVMGIRDLARRVYAASG